MSSGITVTPWESINTRYGEASRNEVNCESCSQVKGVNVPASNYCEDSFQFLCEKCYATCRRATKMRPSDPVKETDMFHIQSANTFLLDLHEQNETKILSISPFSSAPLSDHSEQFYFDCVWNADTNELSSNPLTFANIRIFKRDCYLLQDEGCCPTAWISGIAITNTGKPLMVDHIRDEVTLFSQHMKPLSSIKVPLRGRDIAVISDHCAVVSTDDFSLVLLDISGTLSIKRIIQLTYDVLGIAKFRDKLVTTSPSDNPPSVRLIDLTGKVYWRTFSDEKGQPLFKWPQYVSTSANEWSSTVVVSDKDNYTLTALNADTGEIIARRQVTGWKCPRDVTIDNAGNIYVSYSGTDEVSVLKHDLSEERVIVSAKDQLSGQPRVLAYNQRTNQLIISIWHTEIIDCFTMLPL